MRTRLSGVSNIIDVRYMLWGLNEIKRYSNSSAVNTAIEILENIKISQQ